MSTHWAKRLLPEWVRAARDYAPAGLHHYVLDDDGLPVRIHLRIEPDGRALLLVNASQLTELSRDGALIAWKLLEGETAEGVKRHFAPLLRDRERRGLEEDIQRILARFRPHSNDGSGRSFNFEDPAFSAGRISLLSPLGADLDSDDSEQTRLLLERLWLAKIPQVTFHFKSETDADAAVRAVEAAEDLGMIAAVRPRAPRLLSAARIEQLALAGLDYAIVPFCSSHPETHDALCGAGAQAAAEAALESLQRAEVSAAVQIALVPQTLDELPQTLETLARHGVSASFIFAIASASAEDSGALPQSALRQAAAIVEEESLRTGMRCIWQPPHQYDPRRSIADQIRSGSRTSSELFIRVSREGAVVPSRGPYISAGNMFEQEWDRIWREDVFERYRLRAAQPTHCPVCPGLLACAVACPADEASWAMPEDEEIGV